MTDTKQDIVILEFGSHEDSFYSHFLFLQEHYRVHLVVNEKLLPLIPQSLAWASVTGLKIEGRKSLSVSREARKFIMHIDPQLVFFHTAQGNIVRELTFLLPLKYKMTGVHHNADKLIKGASFSQKLISWRLKNYFVLADYVKENLVSLIPKSISLQEVYTVYYEKPVGFRDLKKNRPLRVAIPGAVEQTRRDFLGLLEALKKTTLSPDVEFVVLGNGSRGEGPAIRNELEAMGLGSQFIFFDGYVSAADMASYMASSDVIVPLMHPQMKYFDLFSKYKISGSFNWSYGYRKPMLMHQELAKLSTFKDLSIAYTMENLVETINKLAQDLTPLVCLADNIAKDPRFDFEHQKKAYGQFVKKVLG